MFVNVKIDFSNKNEIKQVGNLTNTEHTRENPNRDRVYLINGIAPCVVDYSRGGHLFPLVIVDEK